MGTSPPPPLRLINARDEAAYRSMQAVIFDIDGTLTRTIGFCDELYAAAIASVIMIV